MCLVIVVIGCVVISSVAVSSFGVVAGGTDGVFCRSSADHIIVDSLVVVKLERFHWHPGRACRIVLRWKIVSSWVIVGVTWIISS